MNFLTLLKVVLTIFGILRKIDFQKAIEIAKTIRDLLESMKDKNVGAVNVHGKALVAMVKDHAQGQ